MGIKKFAIVVDGEVAATIHFSDEEAAAHEPVGRMVAALSSDPKVIQSPIDVEFGWTYDGSNFIPPVG